MNDQELHAFCQNWRPWAESRCFYAPPVPPNILAALIPHPVRQAPDAEILPEMSFFNLAVHGLLEDYPQEAECFTVFYWYNAKNIKHLAGKIGISRVAFYDRTKKFARQAIKLSRRVKAAFALATESKANALQNSALHF